MRPLCCIQLGVLSTLLFLCGCGSNSMTTSRFHFNPPFSYHTLEIGPFPLYEDNEYRFNLSKLQFDKRSQVMVYYSIVFLNEDLAGHKSLLDAGSLELDIWQGEKLVYSFHGQVPFDENGGKKQPDGEWIFAAPKEKLAIGKHSFSSEEINNSCSGCLRLKSMTSQAGGDAKATITVCIKELTSK